MTSLKYSPESDSNPENNFSRIQDNFFTKELLKRLDKYNNDQDINLEQSIPVLYELNIFQELTSIPDAKKRLTQESKPNNRLQLQARFIYNLWKLISQEFIKMKDFKEIVSLFISEQTSDLALRLEQTFEDEGSLIIELLAIWEAMLQNKSHYSSYQEFRESSVLTQQGNFNTSNDSYKNNSKQASKYHPTHNYSNISHEQHGISLNKMEKENLSQMGLRNNQTYTDRFGNKTRRQNIEEVRNQIYNSNLYEIPVMTVEKEKELVNRLYVVNKYQRYREIKKIQDEQKLQRQMEECTFRPNIEKEKRKRPETANKIRSSRAQSKPIPGFQKAIERMKIGQEKTKQLKQKLELRNINVKDTKEEHSKPIVPPKFLTRENKKQEKKVLFTIQFDIGRHKLTCKIHQSQSAEQLAKNIQSIYSLKQDSYEEIKNIIGQEMQRYFELNQEGQQSNRNQQNDQNQDFEEHYQEKQNSNNYVFC